MSMNVFSIENIGPIKRGEVRFDDKIIIVGGNSTGKTILSTALYLLLTLSGVINSISPIINLGKEIENELSKMEPEEKISRDIVVDVTDLMNINRDNVNEAIRNHIRRIFGIHDHSELIRLGESSGSLRLNGVSIKIDQNDVSLEINDSIEKLQIPLEFTRIQNLPGCTATYIGERIVAAGGNMSCVRGLIASIALSRAINPPEGWRSTAFISTERVAMGGLIPVISNIFSPISSPKVIKPLVLDYLRWLPPGRHKIEAGGGAMKEDFQVVVEFPQTSIRTLINGKEVSQSMISTGLYQVAVIDIISKNPAVDSMIIEEPEINLHIDMQLQLAQYLASLNKKLLITTHSEWIAMKMAHILKRKLNIYEIYDGELREVKINEDGTIEPLNTILPHEETFIKESLGD